MNEKSKENIELKIGDFFEGEKIVRIFDPHVSFEYTEPYIITEKRKKTLCAKCKSNEKTKR